MKPKHLRLLLTLVAMLLLTACAGQIPAAPEESETDAEAPATAAEDAPAAMQQQDSVRFLIAENFWADWEPYQSSAQSQHRLTRQIYDRLVEIHSSDITELSPGLATSWEQIDDRTWELTLREGVTFHNGQAFTAEDVKASIERASGATDVETVLAGNWVPTTVEIIDPLTVRMTTEEPFGPFLVILAQTDIVSADDLAQGEEHLRAAPNGTGPFRLVEEEPTRKVMEAYADYWRGPAEIEELTWEFVQDPQTRLNALLAGQAHAIDRVPPEHLEIIEQTPELALESQTAIEAVMLWVHPGRLDLWTENEDFRKAVAWSFERQPLVDNLVMGNSELMSSFLPSGTTFHQSQSPEYGLDPEQAQAYLEAAGVPDGGPEFELWAATGFQPRSVEVVEAIADDMRAVGLKPQIVTSDVSGMIDDIFTEGGTGVMYHLSWSSSGEPHNALSPLASPFIWSDGDPTIDELVQEGVRTTDPAAREAIYQELQEYMWNKVPHIPLYNSDFTVGRAASLQGLRVLPNSFITDFYPARIVVE